MTTMQADVPGDVDARVGKRVFLLMWERHLTQTAVAARLGIEQSALSRKLRGNRGWSIRELMVIAKVLETSTAYLLGETEDPRPTQPDPDGDGGARHPSTLGGSPTGQKVPLLLNQLVHLPELGLVAAHSDLLLSPKLTVSTLTRASLDRAA